jgi:hypothetical protein
VHRALVDDVGVKDVGHTGHPDAWSFPTPGNRAIGHSGLDGTS